MNIYCTISAAELARTGANSGVVKAWESEHSAVESRISRRDRTLK